MVQVEFMIEEKKEKRIPTYKKCSNVHKIIMKEENKVETTNMSWAKPDQISWKENLSDNIPK